MTTPPPSEGFPPPATGGGRLAWVDLPERVQAAVETRLGGGVVSAVSQPGGFSPGLAARLWTADGSRFFAKAVGPAPNPEAAAIHRREAGIAAALPHGAPVPRLLWSHDEGEGGWVVLVFEDVAGRPPMEPWRPDELDRVLAALVALSAALTPSPLPPTAVGPATAWNVASGGWWRRLRDNRQTQLDAWSARHLPALADLEAAAPAAVGGETLLHLDLRGDNLLLTPDRVLVVDWPHARIGAAWLDLAFFAPSVTMQGGPDPETLLAQHPAARAADAAAVTAAVAAVAGFFTHEALRSPPPGLPTLQAAQGRAARRWLANRTGWA